MVWESLQHGDAGKQGGEQVEDQRVLLSGVQPLLLAAARVNSLVWGGKKKLLKLLSIIGYYQVGPFISSHSGMRKSTLQK